MLWRPFLELILKCLFMVQSKYLNEDTWWKFFQNFSKTKTFYNRSNKWLKSLFWHGSAVELVGVKILYALEMRMRKLLLSLSIAQIHHEKINKMLFLNNLGFTLYLQIWLIETNRIWPMCIFRNRIKRANAQHERFPKNLWWKLLSDMFRSKKM